MREFIIGPNDSGQRADKFLTKAVPSLPRPLLYKYLRMKRIKCNGKRCEISTQLQEGDVIQSRYAVMRRDRTIHARMREYLYELKHAEALETVILPVGDGVALTTKK